MESLKNKFLNIFAGSIIFLLLAVIVYSCKDSDNGVYGPSTYPIDTTILRTDSTGRVLGGDESDWCRHGTSYFSFGPAFPNPANDSTTVLFRLPQSDTLSLYFYDGSDTTFVIKKEILFAGYYAVDIKGSRYGFYNKIKRLYIRNNRGFPLLTSGCNNYGDIYFR